MTVNYHGILTLEIMGFSYDSNLIRKIIVMVLAHWLLDISSIQCFTTSPTHLNIFTAKWIQLWCHTKLFDKKKRA